MFTYLRHLSCLALVATIPGLSQAQTTLQAYEPFSYTAGQTVNGQNGGTGFDTTGATWVDNSLTSKVSTSGLSFGALSTTGNAATVSSGGFQAATRDLGVAPVADGSGNFWLSFLIQRNNTTGSLAFQANEYAGITIGGPTTTPSSRTFIGAATVSGGSSTDIRYTVGTNGNASSDVATNTVAVATSTTNDVALIAARINVNTGLVDVFINPTTLGTGSGPATPSFSYTNGTFTNGKTIALAYGSGADYTVDELRIGQTFIDVTPVPEPTTMVALSIMAIGGGTWLRKKKLAANESQPILAI